MATPSKTMSLFHGGVRGLRPGEVLLPRARTRVQTAPYAGVDYSPDFVYLSTSEGAARVWAAVYVQFPIRPDSIGGDLYEAEPLADVEPDPDDPTPGISVRTRLARVVRVIERRVQLPDEEVDELMTRAIESHLEQQHH